jgi:protein TonB
MPEAAPDAPPANLPSLNQGSTTLGIPNPTGVLGVGQTDGANTGVGVGRYSTGQVIDVEMAQVQVLHRVDPVYPALARLVGAQGDVVLRMTIDAKGLPSEVKVVSGPEALRAEALRCARQWRFTPALMGGEAVPAAFNLTLRFMLRR